MKHSLKHLWLVLTMLIVSFHFAALAQTIQTLHPLTSFGSHGDGSIRPNDQTWVDDEIGMNQHGLAYDPVSGNLVYVNSHSGVNGTTNVQGTIEILDGTSGAELRTLNTNGITGGTYADFTAVVADDGAVYVCNQVLASLTVPIKIYRWDSVNSTNPPIVAFNGTTTVGDRYGTSIDIRGAGTGTQIIMGSMLGNFASRVVIFTTADGTNFNATLLATDITTPTNFKDGIAFGVGNTFWTKHIGEPLRYMSFDLGTGNTSALASFTNANMVDVSSSLATANMMNVQNLGPIALDNANHLLAAMGRAVGAVTSAPQRIWLFDIADPTKAPLLLGYRDFTPNNQNATTTPPGYLDFGGGRLYAAVTRNGLLASSVDTVPMPSPIIFKNVVATNRVAIGQTAHFEVQAYPSITNYVWRLNGSPIDGETNYFLDVPNVQTNDTGKIYSVVVSNPAGSTNSSDSRLVVVNPDDFFLLTPLWSASSTVFPGPTKWYLGTGGGTPIERTIAYNALSNQLYVVRRQTTLVRISVVDADTGFFLYLLKTNGIVGGNIPLCAIGVAADGAIYACDSIASADVANFKIYRWADSGPNTLPTLIFQGNPAPDVTSASFRWGDNMDVRGSGTNTEIILDAQDETRYIGIIKPTDATMTTWTASGYLLQNDPSGPGGGAGGTGIGRSLQFGVGGTFWQKRWADTGAPLVESSYNKATTGTNAPLVLSSSGLPLYANGPVGLNFSLKLGAAINFVNGGNASPVTVPDSLDLYDLTSPTTPLLLNRYNFPGTTLQNLNHIGQVLFTTNYLFALDANQGVLAFKITAPPSLSITRSGNDLLLSWPSSATGFALEKTASLSAPNWAAVTLPVQEQNGQNVVTDQVGGDAAFYRLIKP